MSNGKKGEGKGILGKLADVVFEPAAGEVQPPPKEETHDAATEGAQPEVVSSVLPRPARAVSRTTSKIDDTKAKKFRKELAALLDSSKFGAANDLNEILEATRPEFAGDDAGLWKSVRAALKMKGITLESIRASINDRKKILEQAKADAKADVDANLKKADADCQSELGDLSTSIENIRTQIKDLEAQAEKLESKRTEIEQTYAEEKSNIETVSNTSMTVLNETSEQLDLLAMLVEKNLKPSATK